MCLNKTIKIDNDETWGKVKSLALLNNETISEFCMKAIKRYIFVCENNLPRTTDQCERILQEIPDIGNQCEFEALFRQSRDLNISLRTFKSRMKELKASGSVMVTRYPNGAVIVERVA